MSPIQQSGPPPPAHVRGGSSSGGAQDLLSSLLLINSLGTETVQQQQQHDPRSAGALYSLAFFKVPHGCTPWGWEWGGGGGIEEDRPDKIEKKSWGLLWAEFSGRMLYLGQLQPVDVLQDFDVWDWKSRYDLGR